MMRWFGRRELPPAKGVQAFPVGRQMTMEEYDQWILDYGNRDDPIVRDEIRTILRERREEDPSNGAPPLEVSEHGLFAWVAGQLRGVRPGRRAFALRGVAWKAVLLLVVFVASLVGQVWFMDVTGAVGRSDLWSFVVFVPWCESLMLVVLLAGGLSPFMVFGFGGLRPRWWPVCAFFGVVGMVFVGSCVGQEVGRVWLWERYVATGLRSADGFVDLSSYDHRPATLYWPDATGPWWPLGLAAGVLLVGGVLLMVRERLFGNVFVWLFDRGVFGSGVVCAVASVGLFLAGHGFGDSMVMVVGIALFVLLLWFPLDCGAVMWCVEKRRGAEGEWCAAFFLAGEALFAPLTFAFVAAMI